MKGLFAWVGFRTAYVPFTAEPRIAGHTKFTWGQLFRLAFTGLTSFTVVPLRLVSLAGLVISLTSLSYGVYLLFEHFVEGDHLPGWATLSVHPSSPACNSWRRGYRRISRPHLRGGKAAPCLHRRRGHPDQGERHAGTPQFTMRVPASPMAGPPEQADDPDKPAD